MFFLNRELAEPPRSPKIVGRKNMHDHDQYRIMLTHVNRKQPDLYMLSSPAAVNYFPLSCHKIHTQKSGLINASGHLVLPKTSLLSHSIL